ncbi:hypothetical protein E4656_20070 [Natronospirillum operosum]|uniref:Integrase catalytic domain-containing protein n=1 Tax=Natronospirillum operosum TaxID=2759953 RepID=A0A4Z0W7K9_9GAMM|nr:hypothetical protein E4656_20070 [Natronospirillum operosum]
MPIHKPSWRTYGVRFLCHWFRFLRRIVSWKLSHEKTAMVSRVVLRSALDSRQPAPGLIFHTDRGVEYGAHEVQNLLQRHNVLSSMNRPWTVHRSP